MAFEFCILTGEGTLIDYGVCDAQVFNGRVAPDSNVIGHENGDCSGAIANLDGSYHLVFWRPCNNECETGI